MGLGDRLNAFRERLRDEASRELYKAPGGETDSARDANESEDPIGIDAAWSVQPPTRE